MKATRKILVWDNSVILGPIKDRLRRVSQFEVTTPASLPLEPQQADDIKPDLVLFDLEAHRSDAVFSFLKADPAPLLIGVSPGVNLVRVWHSHQMQAPSVEELIDLIKTTEKISS